MKTTIGVFTSQADAERAINDIRGLGIADDHISFISTKTSEVRTETEESSADGTATGLASGAVIGAVAGLAVASGILPGLGALFVAGPLATSLGLTGAAATTAAGALTGAAAGGIIGALTDLGASPEEAKVYEERIRQGDILVSVASASEAVRDVFERHNAQEIRQY